MIAQQTADAQEAGEMRARASVVMDAGLRQTHARIALPAAISKMVADCEVLYIPVFVARTKMAEGFLL